VIAGEAAHHVFPHTHRAEHDFQGAAVAPRTGIDSENSEVRRGYDNIIWLKGRS
jgi:hypothetical protein